MGRIETLKEKIRAVPDFPKKGILFRDITPLLASPEAFSTAIDLMIEPLRGRKLGAVAGIESRGFIFAAAIALRLGIPFVPIRKPGKLPCKTRRMSYALEYGTDSIEIHEDAFPAGTDVLLVDDLLATGGTMEAAVRLVKELGGKPVEALFLIELEFLEGRKRLLPLCPVRSILPY